MFLNFKKFFSPAWLFAYAFTIKIFIFLIIQ